jgi:hypothetical protein
VLGAKRGAFYRGAIVNSSELSLTIARDFLLAGVS